MLAALFVCNSVRAHSTLAWQLYERGDVFGLNDELMREPATGTPQQRFLRAFLLASFGRESASASLLEELVTAPDRTLARRARLLLMLDERALFHYGTAWNAMSPLLDGNRDPEFENRARFLKAIADVPPETVENRETILLRGPEIAAAVGNVTFRLLVDTGASFSVLSRSAARTASLQIRPVRYEIESVIGAKLRVDVAVGDLTVAGTRVRNVIFLVVPDTALHRSMPFQGVVGVPVLRLLGPLTIGGNAKFPSGRAAPIAFLDGNPVVQAEFHRRRTLCRLDTGASRSSFTPLAAGALLPAAAAPVRRVTQEAMGGARTTAAYETPLAFSVAGRPALLRQALVIRLPGRARNASSCRLGADAIAALAPVSIDLSRMSLVLQ
jgi:hypothetical protein